MTFDWDKLQSDEYMELEYKYANLNKGLIATIFLLITALIGVIAYIFI